MSADRARERRTALLALLMVLVPNLLLAGLGLVMRGEARQAAESRAAADFGASRFLRQVGLQGFLLLPMGLWLWHRQMGWERSGWGCRRVGRALGVGAILGAAVLLVRARPFDPQRLRMRDTWWALTTYGMVALAEETLYRGLLQRALSDWLGRWAGYLATALLFTALHLPQLLLGGEPLAPTLVYAARQLLPMALLFGCIKMAARQVAAPALVHLAWNWASMLRSV